MMKFSLIHPSRGRPQQALVCLRLWRERFSGENELEYVLSIDTDDAVNYLSVIPDMHAFVATKVCVNPNKSVVPALNAGAEKSTGDVLIYLSDDFECPLNWDLELQKVIGQETDFVVEVSDGIQNRTQTISILSRAYYKRFGYIYYPKYISVYADNEITEISRASGRCLNGKHLLFKHNHYSVKGGLPIDDTYKKENSSEAYRIGGALFKQRKMAGFPNDIPKKE